MRTIELLEDNGGGLHIVVAHHGSGQSSVEKSLSGFGTDEPPLEMLMLVYNDIEPWDWDEIHMGTDAYNDPTMRRIAFLDESTRELTIEVYPDVMGHSGKKLFRLK